MGTVKRPWRARLAKLSARKELFFPVWREPWSEISLRESRVKHLIKKPPAKLKGREGQVVTGWNEKEAVGGNVADIPRLEGQSYIEKRWNRIRWHIGCRLFKCLQTGIHRRGLV